MMKVLHELRVLIVDVIDPVSSNKVSAILTIFAIASINEYSLESWQITVPREAILGICDPFLSRRPIVIFLNFITFELFLEKLGRRCRFFVYHL